VVELAFLRASIAPSGQSSALVPLIADSFGTMPAGTLSGTPRAALAILRINWSCLPPLQQILMNPVITRGFPSSLQRDINKLQHSVVAQSLMETSE